MRIIAWCLVLIAAAGCEGLQRKFTRKPKHPLAAPSPIIQFQDYSKMVNPEDRYRKHYMMFDYWNHDLVDGLRVRPLNQKRYRKAAEESQTELETLKALLEDEPAGRLGALVDERAKIVKRLADGISDLHADSIIRDLESQARALHREFATGDVKDKLRDAESIVDSP